MEQSAMHKQEIKTTLKLKIYKAKQRTEAMIDVKGISNFELVSLSVFLVFEFYSMVKKKKQICTMDTNL